MEQIAVKPKLYFYLEGKTTFNEIGDFGAQNINKVFEEAQKAGLEKTGPLEFIYFDATDDKDKEFVLHIALPVKEQKQIPQGFHYRQAKPFKCLKERHKGPISELGEVYDSIFEYVWNHSLKKANEIREVYHSFEHPHSTNNLTEIQVGLN